MREFKVGDKVRDILFNKEGRVLSLSDDFSSAITVQFNTFQGYYFLSGKMSEFDKTPRLYHADQKVTILVEEPVFEWRWLYIDLDGNIRLSDTYYSKKGSKTNLIRPIEETKRVKND